MAGRTPSGERAHPRLARRGAGSAVRPRPPSAVNAAVVRGRSADQPLPPEMFINRELSWLEFNRRVLEEAEEADKPLLERAKFAAIFSSNLDEWFMIRVAGVKRKVMAGIAEPGPSGRTPTRQLADIQRAVQALLDRQAALLRDDLLPALAAHGVGIVPYTDLQSGERETLADVFEREIFPVLTPQAIDRGRRFPHVSNGSLNLLVAVRLPGGARFARIKIPGVVPRLVLVPGAAPGVARFVWLEQLVVAHLPRLFPRGEIAAAYPFHVVRDSDIVLDDEEEDADGTADILALMREHLSQRTFGTLVRLTLDRAMPPDLRDWLAGQLHAGPRDRYVVDGPLAPQALFELEGLARPDLKDPAFAPSLPPRLRPAPNGGQPVTRPDVFAAVRQGDVLLHHPYQSFAAVTDFVRAAALDPDVVAIKQTLYRIGRDSPLIPALIAARDDDTQVAAVVEVKARFDEENNISWAERLEEHGVHVAYGLPTLKTHCKATLVVRREADGLRRYVHLSTGNYNATTARLYEDIGLLTAREEIAADVAELFNMLTGYAQPERYATLWVAPHHLRTSIRAAIQREVAAHQRTGHGRLIFKCNALTDREVIRALYAASRAGVDIDLIVRGPCCLRPGVPGWSESVRVVSIVGRFLEHSRIYAFGSGDAAEVYLGSADLMERNFDRRVETVFRVDDRALAAHLRAVVLPAYLRDTVNARELHPDGSYTRRVPAPGEAPFDVQQWLLDLYHDAAPAAADGGTDAAVG